MCHRVDEVTSLEVFGLQLNREGRGFVNDIVISRVHELDGRHVVCGGDVSHGCWIARPRPDLLSVGDGIVQKCWQAEVDKVVRGGETGDLAILRWRSVRCESSRNDGGM
jgi:hypothetical protein